MGRTVLLKAKPRVSRALWIPFAWMLLSASKPIGAWMNPAGDAERDISAYLEGNPAERVVFSALIALSVYVLVRRKADWAGMLRSNPFLALWFLYCGASILWSDFHMISLKRWIKEVGTLLSILVVLTEARPVDAVLALLKRFVYLAIPASILLIVFYPPLGMKYMLEIERTSYVGISDSKNGLGRICMFAGLFLFYSLLRMAERKSLREHKAEAGLQALLTAMVFALLLASASMTALSLLLLGILLILALRYGLTEGNARYLEIFAVSGLVLLYFLQISFDLVGLFLHSASRDVTLTGRTGLWKDLLAFHTNPVIGVGYGSFWLGKRLDTMWTLYTWMPNESHNGYLKVYLELGGIGLALMAGLLWQGYRNIKASLTRDKLYGIFRLAVFLVALLYNITEDAFGRMTLMWYVFLLVSLEVPAFDPLRQPERYTRLVRAPSPGQ